MSVKLSGDSVRSYLRDIGRIPLLEHDEEILLGRKVQRLMEIQAIEADDKAAERITEKEPASKSAMAKRQKTRWSQLTSVLSCLSLRNTLNGTWNSWISSKKGRSGSSVVWRSSILAGYKFSTYAYWWIRQGITRAIAEKSRAIRLPIHVTENLNKLKKAQRELSQLNGELPNVFQLSDHLGLTVDEIKDLMCKARQPTSLEIKIGENRDTSLIDLLEDESQLPEMLLERQFIKEDIRELIEDLRDAGCCYLYALRNW